MTQIIAYLNFGGNCREAMSFYKESLGGELMLQPLEGSPAESKSPANMKNQIMHSSLVKDGLTLMASDMFGPEGIKQGNNMALLLNCSSEPEINLFFEKLSEGGKVLEPLRLEFWGAMFGYVEDRFGIRWMFTYQKNPPM